MYIERAAHVVTAMNILVGRQQNAFHLSFFAPGLQQLKLTLIIGEDTITVSALRAIENLLYCLALFSGHPNEVTHNTLAR